MAKPRRKLDEADRYLRWADIATGATLLALFTGILLRRAGAETDPTLVSDGLKALAVIAVIVFFVSIAMLFRRRMRDEFLESLWNSGVSASFLATVAYAFASAVVAALMRVQAMQQHVAVPVWVDHLPRHALLVALAAFFLAFHVKRWRSR